MRLVNNLNINNTFRALNLNTYVDPVEEKVVRVTNQNKDKITNILKENNGYGYTFIIDVNNYSRSLSMLVYKSDAFIRLNVDGKLPIPILFDIGSNRKAQAIYKYHENYSKEELQNMSTVAEVIKTSVLLSADSECLPDITKMLFNINDLRFIIDRFYLNLEDCSEKQKLAYFKGTHEVLARWKIQLYLKCLTEKERQALLEAGVLIGS